MSPLLSVVFVIGCFLIVANVCVIGFDSEERDWLKLVGEDDSNNLTNCGDEDDHFLVSAVIFQPPQPMRGEQLQIDIDGLLKKTIPNGSYLELTVKVAGIPLFDGNMDFCQQLLQMSEKNPAIPTCPVQPGRVMLSHAEKIPQGIPRGQYEIRVLGFTPHQSRIFCVSGIINLQ